MNTAVIVAGGFGSRFGSKIPKQFVEVQGFPIIYYTVAPFLQMEEIHKIVIVCHVDYIDYTKNLFKHEAKISIITGGQTRFQSCKNAIDCLHGSGTKNVLIHDAARPLITKEIIQKCIEKLNYHRAVTVAVPARDTMVQVQSGMVKSVPVRAEMFANQTPQCFNFNLIHAAYSKAMHSEFTDDVSVVLGQCDIAVVEGSERNVKITYESDLKIMKLFL